MFQAVKKQLFLHHIWGFFSDYAIFITLVHFAEPFHGNQLSETQTFVADSQNNQPKAEVLPVQNIPDHFFSLPFFLSDIFRNYIEQPYSLS